MKHIGIVLFDGVEELDAVGPWEVLSAWTRMYPDDGYAVSCLSASGGSVQCAKGLVLGAHHSHADAPPLDVRSIPAVRVRGHNCSTTPISTGCAGSAPTFR